MPHPRTHSQNWHAGVQSQACGVYRVHVHEFKPLHRLLAPAHGDLGYPQDMKASPSGLQAVVGRDSLLLLGAHSRQSSPVGRQAWGGSG